MQQGHGTSNVVLEPYDKNLCFTTAAPLKPASFRPKPLEENTTTQRGNGSYFYQATDFHNIIQSPDIQGRLAGFWCLESMTFEVLKSRIVEILQGVTPNKPAFYLYNLYNIHWVTLCLIKTDDNKTLALYKDSLGGKNDSLATLLKEHHVEMKYHRGNEQQNDEANCGLFALENMLIMAAALKGERNNFLSKFENWKFCTLEKALQGRETYADCYKEGTEVLAAQAAVEAVERATETSGAGS